MDISVSQLNHRLALQLPAELPLGLVFVAGVVRHFERGDEVEHGRTLLSTFELEQNGHQLRCKLVQREAERVQLHENMEVRLGGHLTFDPRYAAYYLLARDVEIIGPNKTNKEVDPLAIDLGELVEDQAAFSAALVGIKRRANVARQPGTSMPDWVQKIAPPELQEQESEGITIPDENVPEEAMQPVVSSVLNEELVSYLSALMESDEDVELTPDMLTQWTVEHVVLAQHEEPVTTVPPPPLVQTETEEVMIEAATAVSPYDPVGDTVPAPKVVTAVAPSTEPRHQTDWLVIVLLIVMVMFTIALCLVAVLLR